jgi:serine/threonine-protein kinase
MFTQLLSQPPIPLNKARPNLDFGAQIEGVIMRGLAREPSERYPDVLTFARELNGALTSAQEAAAAAPPPSEDGLFSRMKGLFRR